MIPLLREHRLKLAAPVLLTVFAIAWTVAVQPFARSGNNWAIWPVILCMPLATAAHIYLVSALRPKWPLVGYAIVHLLALLLIATICIMRIAKDSL